MLKSTALFIAVLCFGVGFANAALTDAQKTALLADINSDGARTTQLATGKDSELAAYYNAAAVTSCWRTSVSLLDVGAAFNGAEWAGMTTANHTRLQTVAQYLAQGVNPSISGTRAMFDDIWSGAGGTVTRANLLSLWQWPCTRLQSLLSTVDGAARKSQLTTGPNGYLTTGAEISSLRP